MKKRILIIFFSVTVLCSKAQLLSELNHYHNQVFFGPGYTLSFINISYGWQHTKYFKRFKKHITSILDFSTPLSLTTYTRWVIRKGFQMDVYKNEDFEIPVAIISSSARKHYKIFDFHDMVTDFYVCPGVYNENYTIAADLNLNVIWFRNTHFDEKSFTEVVPTGLQKDWRARFRLNPAIGIALGRNTERMTFLLRGGYQRPQEWEVYRYPFYASFVAGIKFNFKKKAGEEDILKENRNK